MTPGHVVNCWFSAHIYQISEDSIKMEQPNLMAISLSSRIPEFWMDQPRVWFIRIEAVLAPQKLSDEAKFDIVVSKLSKEVVAELTSFLENPPAAEKYKTLKAKILSLLEESSFRQIEKLIKEMELGDQKPSQLLRKMKDLARDKIPDATLRVLWQGHLPQAVRAVLMVTESKDLEGLAKIADSVTEVTKTNSISEVESRPSVSKEKHDDSSVILAEIAKLSMRMSRMERSQNFRGRSRSTSRASSTGRQRRTPESPDWLCFYHFRFRERANKCVQPCSWRSDQGN